MNSLTHFQAEDLAQWCKGEWLGRIPQRVGRLVMDARQLEPGGGFVALKTGRRDGHDFIEQAWRAGASCALVSCPQPDISLAQLLVKNTLCAIQDIAQATRRQFSRPVIAISGSCGKTTTKDFLAHLMGKGCYKTQGNLNNYMGVPLTLCRLDSKQYHYAVIEAGINEPGEMETLASMIQADCVLITMVGASHLAKLGSLECVAEEKAKLVDAKVGSSYASVAKEVVFPASCLKYEAFRKMRSRATVVVCGDELRDIDLDGVGKVLKYWVKSPDSQGAVMSDDVRAGARHSQGAVSRITCEDVIDGSLQVYDLPFCSQGLISNAILAIATARKYGVSIELIRSRLLNWKQSEHRGVWIETETQHIYDDSYNANPDSMREALDAFVQGATEARPRLYVLGGMKELGDNGMALHREIGQELPLRSIDRAILIGEEALGYHEGMLSAGHREQSIHVFSDLDSAISQIMDFTGSVFLKGSNFYKLSNIVELVRHRSRQ